MHAYKVGSAGTRHFGRHSRPSQLESIIFSAFTWFMFAIGPLAWHSPRQSISVYLYECAGCLALSFASTNCIRCIRNTHTHTHTETHHGLLPKLIESELHQSRTDHTRIQADCRSHHRGHTRKATEQGNTSPRLRPTGMM